MNIAMSKYRKILTQVNGCCSTLIMAGAIKFICPRIRTQKYACTGISMHDILEFINLGG